MTAAVISELVQQIIDGLQQALSSADALDAQLTPENDAHQDIRTDLSIARLRGILRSNVKELTEVRSQYLPTHLARLEQQS